MHYYYLEVGLSVVGMFRLTTSMVGNVKGYQYELKFYSQIQSVSTLLFSFFFFKVQNFRVYNFRFTPDAATVCYRCAIAGRSLGSLVIATVVQLIILR